MEQQTKQIQPSQSLQPMHYDNNSNNNKTLYIVETIVSNCNKIFNAWVETIASVLCAFQHLTDAITSTLYVRT